MLSIARQRAASLGLQDVVEFKEGDAEIIDLPTLIFDAALCRWGLMLLPDPKAAFSNVNKSLVNGGHFGSSSLVFPRQSSFPFRTHELHT